MSLFLQDPVSSKVLVQLLEPWGNNMDRIQQISYKNAAQNELFNHDGEDLMTDTSCYISQVNLVKHGMVAANLFISQPAR